jgi:hypothetical protein
LADYRECDISGSLLLIPGRYQDFSIAAGLKNNISKQQRGSLAACAGELRKFSPAIFNFTTDDR